MEQILLRNRNAFLQGEAPSDWIMLIKEVKLSSAGYAVIDLGGVVAPGTLVYYTLLSASNVWGGTTQTVQSLAVDKKDAILGINSTTTVDFNLLPSTQVPANSEPAIALVFFKQTSQAQHGESFV